jgi:hypothetical protein
VRVERGGIFLRVGDYRFLDAMVELRCAYSTLLAALTPPYLPEALMHRIDQQHEA